MAVTIREVTGKAGRAEFIRAQWLFHVDDPAWVPPLLLERSEFFDPKKNPFYEQGEVALFLAERDGRTVGRISAQIDHESQRHLDPELGYFGFCEGIDDREVFTALTDAAETWLGARGMKRVRGPFGFNFLGEVGLLVDGFERPPAVLMGHARPWVAGHLEALGYVRGQDGYAYRFDLAQEPLGAAARRMVERLTDDPEVVVRPLRRKEFAEELVRVHDILNDAWAENWGFVPLTRTEIEHLGKDMKMLLDDDFVAVAEHRGEAVAFGVVLPNLNEILKELDGRLLPFGWLKLLKGLKFGGIRSGRVPLMGVRRRYHGTPLGAAMAYAIIDRLHEAGRKRGYEWAELSWVMADNAGMCGLIEAAGGVREKTYRIYDKDLGQA
jgi:GNAT superfamily N-acetyltransferase